MTTDPKTAGRLAAKMPPEQGEKLKNELLASLRSTCEAAKKRLEYEYSENHKKKFELLRELVQEGVPSKEAIKASMRRGYYVLGLLLICLAGEYTFISWTIGPFLMLSAIELSIISVLTTLIIFKGVASYIQYSIQLKDNNEESQKKIFFQISTLAIIMIFVLIGTLGLIRKDLFFAESSYSSAERPASIDSLEKEAEMGNEFYKKTTMPFFGFQVLLGLISALVGGCAFYESTSRLSSGGMYRAKYRKLESLERKELEIQKQMESTMTKVQSWLAQFQTAYFQEKHFQATGEQDVNNTETKRFSIEKIGAIMENLIRNPWVIFFLSTVIFLLFAQFAYSADHKILLDFSTSVTTKDYNTNVSDFKKNCQGIANYFLGLKAGESVVVIGITENSFSRPYILLEEKMPNTSGYFKEKINRSKIQLIKKWKQMCQSLKPTAKATDIIGALYLLANLGTTNKQTIVIFSDMRQATGQMNLENKKDINVKALMQLVREFGLIPDLDGARVVCAGVSPGGKGVEYYSSLRRFWSLYFQEAGVNEFMFQLKREVHHE
ncbi:MAG: hypothetical protein U5L00_07215 [Desulfovermiculus sp.]|nr:hypothetical protein [Desulfovermiculus sp.]